MKNVYLSPEMEIIEIEIESAVLTASGENSYPSFGE